MENKICPACNSRFKTVYYQRRAADEPPDKVSYCEKCPLDTSRLKLEIPLQDSRGRNNSISKLNMHKRSNSIDVFDKGSQTIFSILENKGYRYRIRVEGVAATRCYKSNCKSQDNLVPIIASVVPLQNTLGKQLIELHKNSVVSQEGFKIIYSKEIAPFIYIDKLRVYKQKRYTYTYSDDIVIGYELALSPSKHSEFTVLRTTQKDKNPSINIFLNRFYEDRSLNEDISLSIVEELLFKYGTENNIKSFISPTLISTLFIQSGKAYDWPSAPNNGYVYTWKPDGERFWYIKYGCIWLFCRRLLSGRIVGWNIGKSITEAIKPGPILDVEILIGHDPILIDILALENGKPTQPSRSLDLVLDMFNEMKNIDINISVRQYFKSQEELLRTKQDLKYPVDGIIGIQDGSMTIIKLKDCKSIELKLGENGNLITEDGIVIANSKLNKLYNEDSIVEIRFTKDSGKSVPIVVETLLRTDKVKANSFEVCKEILETASVMPGTLERRSAVQWCNSIRQKLNEIAAKTVGKGRVILDIGAGDGQAVSDYSKNSDVTYLLIEPNKVKCQKLAKRLMEPGKGSCKTFDSANSITKAIGLLSNATLKYAIICSTIGEVLKQEYCIKIMKSAIRYCVATFSISHTYKELEILAIEGIDVLGCGYMYDKTKKDGILVNEAGVLMKRISQNEASVKWGNDKIYKEIPITTQDFKEAFYIQSAKSLVPLFNNNQQRLLDIVSDKVYIVSTKKYI